MRKLLTGIALFFVLGGVALAWPYRLERIAGHVANNGTGCVIDVSNTNGWKPSTGLMLAEEKLEEPVRAGVAVYECPGTPVGRPVSLTLIAPDTGYRVEGCGGRPEDPYCWLDLPRIPAAADVHRYRLLIQLRPGEASKAVDIEVRRRTEWRSGTFDIMMSV